MTHEQGDMFDDSEEENDEDNGLPHRPYIQDGEPSAGYASTSEASKRAEKIRALSQKPVMKMVVAAQAFGVTGHEASRELGKPNLTSGQSALSVLHDYGMVVRLVQERNDESIYVLPEWALGRPTEPRGSHAPAAQARALREAAYALPPGKSDEFYRAWLHERANLIHDPTKKKKKKPDNPSQGD